MSLEAGGVESLSTSRRRRSSSNAAAPVSGGGDGPLAKARRADFVGEPRKLSGCAANDCGEGGVASRCRFSNLAGSSDGFAPPVGGGEDRVALLGSGASVATLPASDAMNVEGICDQIKADARSRSSGLFFFLWLLEIGQRRMSRRQFLEVWLKTVARAGLQKCFRCGLTNSCRGWLGKTRDIQS